MSKKYIIGICIAVLVWGGFMFYRHHRKKGDTAAYRDKSQKQMLEIAKKSPRAGLVLIGRALDRYYRENHKYPANLDEIYPKYLANKSILEEVGPHYEPRGDDFFLSTTFTVDNRRMVAYLDKDLRPQIDKGVMVASPRPIPKAEAIKKPERAQRPEPSERTRLALAREAFLQSLRQGRIRVTSVSLPERDEVRLIATVQPEVVLIMESDIRSDVESELSQRYLVWKGINGVLGFSNVQYPDADSLSIFAFGRWYNIKIPLEKGHEALGLKAEAARKKERPEMMALNLNSSYLVWKDKHGAVGFGNVQYPENDLESVFQTDGWVSMKRPALVARETGVEEKYGSKKEKSPETIASEFSASCLVWKDRHGALGFGNVQYPENDLESVFQTDGWVKMKRPALVARETGVEEKHGSKKEKSPETIASEFSVSCLVWKDRHGAVGFGNVQYPEKDLESVFQADGWVSMKRPLAATGTAVERNQEMPKRKSAQKIGSEFGTRYLVWKDKHGALGFGNIQYPDLRGISHVHLNGSWEPVAN